MHTIIIRSAPYGIDASPLWGICAEGNFPHSIPCDTIADWSQCRFASISHIAAVTAVQNASYESGMHRSCVPSSSVNQYISRMNYYELAGIDHEECFTRHSERDKFLPMAQIEDHNANDIATRLRSTVTSHLPFSESAVDMMDYAFGEVLDNVLQHSRTYSRGIACSQYYPHGNYVEICIADCGQGIPKSMSGNHLYSGLDDGDLLIKAFDRFTGEYYGIPSYGTSRVSGGMGLWTASNIARALGGYIWAVSTGSALEVSSSGTKRIDGEYFPGTIICMRFPVTSRVVTGDDILGNSSNDAVRWTPSDSWWYEGSDEDVLW